MTAGRSMSRIAAPTLAFVVAAGVLAVLAARLDAPPAQPPVTEGVLIIRGDEPWPPGFELLATAPAVPSVDALDPSLTPAVRLVVLAPGVSRHLRTDALLPVADRGIALMAVETPLAELWRVSGALTMLRRANAGFAAEEVRRTACRGCTEFYAYTWRSCPSDPSQQSGSGQAALAHARFADGLRHVLANTRTCPDVTY